MTEMVTVLIPNVKSKALVQSNNTGKYYIIPAYGYYRNEETKINLANGKEIPSFFYALGELFDENNLAEGISFIKENF